MEKAKRQTTVYKTQHRKTKTKQNEPHKKTEFISINANEVSQNTISSIFLSLEYNKT